MKLPKWVPRYERGLGWQLPNWVRVVLIPFAVVVLVLLVVGETLAMAVWLAKRLIERGK